MERTTHPAADTYDAVALAIQRVVEEARDKSFVIHTRAEAQRIAAEFPASGMTVGEIATALLQAAIAVGAPVQISQA